MEDTKVSQAVQAVQGTPDTPAATEPAEFGAKGSATDPAFAREARREKQLRQQLREIEEQRNQFKAKEQDYNTNYIPKSRLSEDALAVLAEAGISTEKLTEMLLNSNSTASQDPTVRAMQNQIKQLEAKLAENSTRSEEATTQQYEQAKKQIDREVRLLVDSNEEFESIKAEGLQDAVTELIERTFNEEGYLMDIEEAAKEVENHIVQQGLKMAGLKKVQSQLSAKTSQVATESKQQSQTPTIRTLTNSVSQNTPKRNTEKERVERAMAAFHGKPIPSF